MLPLKRSVFVSGEESDVPAGKQQKQPCVQPNMDASAPKVVLNPSVHPSSVSSLSPESLTLV